jgi:hypothetical protein
VAKIKMKYKLTKEAWKSIGKQAGWMKSAQFQRYDYVGLGTTPNDEECAQVGFDNYNQIARIEASAYVNQLKRLFPNIPAGVEFVLNSNPHDFGSYYNLAIKFSENDEEAVNYAFNVENNMPANWDEQAKLELQQQGYFELLKPASQLPPPKGGGLNSDIQRKS